ncbi:unnamed protein product [Urochloa humidicola]
MDVDGKGRASEPYLRAWVAIELAKPLRRGVLLHTKKEGAPEWFDILYEKLTFYCFSCGIMGHTTLDCANLVPRNEEGKLPYETHLRAPDDRRKKIQRFAQAAAESYGPISFSSNHAGDPSGKTEDRRSSSASPGKGKEYREVSSPLKRKEPADSGEKSDCGAAGKELFQASAVESRPPPRKRKPRSSGAKPMGSTEPKLPVVGVSGLVPMGLVHVRVTQLDGGKEVCEEAQEELIKKQKVLAPSGVSGSAAAADGSPCRDQ